MYAVSSNKLQMINYFQQIELFFLKLLKKAKKPYPTNASSFLTFLSMLYASYF